MKSKQTEKLLREIEAEYAVDSFKVDLLGHIRVFEVKVNRDRMTIYKPEGIRGDVIISITPAPIKKKAQPLQMKIHFAKQEPYSIEVPRTYLEMIRDKCSSKKKTELIVHILCSEHAVEGTARVHFNPKLI